MGTRMGEVVEGIGQTNVAQVTPYEAVIQNTVTAVTDNLFVLIPSIDGGRTTKGPVRWQPSPGPLGVSIFPKKGDLAQVVRTNEGFYWVTQFLPAVYPTPATGYGHWRASNSGAAANAYYAWGNQDTPTDVNYYARDTISGQAANTMIKVLIPGWYRFTVSVLTGPNGGIRHDVYFYQFAADKVTNTNVDQSLGDPGVSNMYVKHNSTFEVSLLANQGIGVHNATGSVYNDGPLLWSWISARFLGSN